VERPGEPGRGVADELECGAAVEAGLGNEKNTEKSHSLSPNHAKNSIIELVENENF